MGSRWRWVRAGGTYYLLNLDYIKMYDANGDEIPLEFGEEVQLGEG